MVEQVGKLIAYGLTQEQACLAEDVVPKSFENACRLNPTFRGALKKVHSHFLKRATVRIHDGERGWQGTAWILERRHREQFSRNDPAVNVQVNGQVNVFGLEAAEYEQIKKSASQFMVAAPKPLESGT